MSGPDPPNTLHCLQCGYNLTGLTQNVCPECGAAFNPEKLRALQQVKPPAVEQSWLMLGAGPAIWVLVLSLVFLIIAYLPGASVTEAIVVLVLLSSLPIEFAIISTSITSSFRITKRVIPRRGEPSLRWRAILLSVVLSLLLIGAQHLVIVMTTITAFHFFFRR